MFKNHTSPEGHLLGKNMARFCDQAEPVARLKVPELPPRCNSCAFREGKHLANGSSYTQMDVVKHVAEGVPFYCHQPDRKDELCAGWAYMMLSKNGPDFTKCPWEFSYEGNEND